MNRRLRVLVIVSAALAAPLPAYATGEGPDTLGPRRVLDRPHDAVEVSGVSLSQLAGAPITRLGLVAFHGRRPAPIPFQVDERRGTKLVLTGGPEAERDDQPGVLDADDLVVFMACDAGERADAADVERAAGDGQPIRGWQEIRIRDPESDRTGYAYLLDADRPPHSDRRYVEYVPQADLVSTAGYRIGMIEALPNYFALLSGGAYGPNLLDGIRLRAEAHLHANLLHLKLNEQQGRHRLVAWQVGPVRVVRRSRHQVSIGLGVLVTAAVADVYCYANHVYTPGSLHLPIAPGLLFRDVTAFGGADFRQLDGWRYHAAGVPPEGFAIDGVMDAAERAFDAGGEWFVLSHGDQAVLMVMHMSDNALRRGIRLRLVYADDAARRDPPEAEVGAMPLVGYRALDIHRLPAGRYDFELWVFDLPRYRPGDEQKTLAALAAPLDVRVTEGR